MADMTRRKLVANLAGAANLLTLSTGWAQSSPRSDIKAPALPAIGSLIELTDVPLLDGSLFKPAQVKGQILVIYWWASWCPFCALQSPYMDKLWRQQRTNGLQMLGLSIDRRPEDTIAYMKKKGYTFPTGMLKLEAARVIPKPRGLPVTLVLGRDRRVLMAESGQLFPEDVEHITMFLSPHQNG